MSLPGFVEARYWDLGHRGYIDGLVRLLTCCLCQSILPLDYPPGGPGALQPPNPGAGQYTDAG